MARNRSRDAETESVNQRMLRRGAVKRQHLTRWAVGRDELAPGVVGDTHLNPSTIERIREVSSASGVGQLLVVSATADSISSGGDYVTADAIVYQRGFAGVTADGDSIVWPTDAVGEIQVEFAWDTYTGGGTIEIEVDGVVPAWGLIATGTSGSKGCKRRGVHIAEGAVVKVKVTQTSGVAKTADVLVEFSIPDPTLGTVTSYESVVLDDGPVAYWRLGETAGTAAVDRTGNGHTGTYVGTYTLAATGVMDDGLGDTALDTSGVTGSGMLGADWGDLEFAGTLPYSVECWINADTLTAGSHILVQKASAGNAQGWELIVQGGASPFAQFTFQDATAQVDTAAGSVSVGVDHHVVATFDGTTVSIYIDGALGSAEAAAGSMTGTAVAVSIGYDSVGAGFEFDGRLDEVAIYDRALTAAEVAEHYTVGT